MRILLIRDSEKLPGSYDIGWCVFDPSGQPFKRYWGNCKGDETVLQSLIADCRTEHEFAVEDTRGALCADCGHTRGEHRINLPSPCHHGRTDATALNPNCPGYGCLCIGFRPEVAL